MNETSKYQNNINILNEYKKKLLNMTLSNPLINLRFKPTRTILLAGLNIGTFFSYFDYSVPFLNIYEELAITNANFKALGKRDYYELSEVNSVLQDYQAKNKKRAFYSTSGSSLEKSTLSRLYKLSNLYESEYGLGVLYFSAGIVRYEVKNEGVTQICESPLLLFSAKLSYDMRLGSYSASFKESEANLNDTFIKKIKEEYNIDLNFDISKYNSFEDLYAEYKSLVATQLTQAIDDRIFLSIFQFSKINIINDLTKNEDRVINNKFFKLLYAKDYEGYINEGTLYAPEDIKKTVSPRNILHPLMSDTSQDIAIYSALSGHSFVLQGPPGTGKSQTITNIICELVAKGKKVLFCSEKKAAMDVVYNNLAKVGLSDFSLILHNDALDKKEFIKNLVNSLELAQEANDVEINFYENQLNNLLTQVNKLESYATSLLQPLSPIKENLYTLINEYYKYFNVIEYNFEIEGALEYNFKKIMLVKDLLNNLERAYKEINYDPLNHLFAGFKASSYSNQDIEYFFQDLQELNILINKMEGLLSNKEYLPLLSSPNLNQLELLIQYQNFLKEGFNPPESILSIKNLDEQIAKVNTIIDDYRQKEEIQQQLFAHYETDILKLDLVYHYRVYRSSHSALSRLFSKEYKKSRKLIALYLKQSRKYPEIFQDLANFKLITEINDKLAQVNLDFQFSNLAELTNYLHNLLLFKQYKEFSKIGVLDKKVLLSNDFILKLGQMKIKKNDLSSLETTSKNLTVKLNQLQNLFQSKSISFSHLSLQNLQDLFQQYLDNPSALKEMVYYNYILEQVKKQGITPFFETISKTSNHDNFINFFFKRFYHLVIEYHLSTNESLKNFRGFTYDKIKENYANLEALILQIAAINIKKQLFLNAPSTIGLLNLNMEVQLLKAESRKSRNIKPLRIIFKEMASLILKLKPCLMMSPLAVSSYLESSTFDFDVVIFDEASQVRPESGLCAIYRTKQLIITGDEEQLPPTTFFDTLDTDSEYDEDKIQVNDYDSILALASSGLDTIMLNWHYRSLYEELITPSNKEIYKNLTTFPASLKPTKFEGITLYNVHGIYENAANELEAAKVIEEIDQHINNHPKRSLGVVAFGIKQQSLIESRVNNYRLKNPQNEFFFNAQKVDPFFVKNIETVQGDERDTIIISVGYGPNKENKLNLAIFGPLNQSGGYRRLNVALTRAKINCIFINSFEETKLERSKEAPLNRGLSFLRDYIYYAKNHQVEQRVNSQLDNDTILNDLATELKARGYLVELNFGESNFKLDLVIYDPLENKYLLGLVIDGHNYQSVYLTKVREYLMENSYQVRGWKIYRLWSIEYYNNKYKEIQKIIDFINSPKPKVSESVKIPTTTIKKKEIRLEFEEYPNYEDLLKYQSSSSKNHLLYIIRQTTPLHQDELKRFIAPVYGKQKYSPTVEALLEEDLKSLIADKWIHLANNFIYLVGPDVIFNACGPRSSKRGLEFIDPGEFIDLIEKTLRVVKDISLDDLLAKIATLCGYSRLTPNQKEFLTSLLSAHQLKNVLSFDGVKISLKFR
ncbi:MAG: DUF4011 domain-containing protein [Acholeplasmatales bacterium]|jgi:superfamily I DNA and/or RNA helicase/tetrahydromethanopterin S-methyltransferase subunit B|nr:DUF4011 domain-containing protein [Acholeplasmatales bacterium]